MKRFLSALLALVMVLGLMAPLGTVFAVAPTGGIAGLEDFLQAAESMTTDGYIGIPYDAYTYYQEGVPTDKTRVAIYVINTNTERIGTGTDYDIVYDLIVNKKMTVVVIDYLNNEKSVSPDLDWSIQKIRTSMVSGKHMNDTAYNKDYLAILPAGYTIEMGIVYWSYDKHGLAGEFEYFVDNWNTDVLAAKGDHYSVVHPETGETMTLREYTESLPGGKASTFYDCIAPDGSPLELDLHMDFIYPVNPTKSYPVIDYFGSGDTGDGLLVPWINAGRPHANGFLFNGYGVAFIEHSWTPIARDDAYFGYYGTTYGGISGFRDVAMMDVYCGVEIQTAAVRCIRYLGDTDERFAKIDKDAIGAIGISKSGSAVRLGHPDPTSLEDSYFLEGHSGESRYEYMQMLDGTAPDIYYQDGVVDEDGNKIIRDPEPQPWLTYSDGTPIPSNCQFVFSTVGSRYDTITEGFSAVFCNGGYQDQGEFMSVFKEVSNRCRVEDVPFMGFGIPRMGHELGYGIDDTYGVESYDQLLPFASYYLKDDAPAFAYGYPADGTAAVPVDTTITVKFTGPVSQEEAEKIVITQSDTGKVIRGTWVGSFGNTQWDFTPDSLTGGKTYDVRVSASIVAENGKALQKAGTFSFTTIPEKTAAAQQSSGSVISKTDTQDNAAYAVFDAQDFTNSTTTALRFQVDNDAANVVQVYAIANIDETDITASTQGDLLGEVYITGAGIYDIDVTEYVDAATTGEKVGFILRAKKNTETKTLLSIDLDDLSADATTIHSQLKQLADVRWSVSDEEALSGDQSLKLTGAAESDHGTLLAPYRDARMVALRWYTQSGGLKATDMGRKINVSVSIYDTISRRIGLYSTMGYWSSDDGSEKLIDKDCYYKNYITTPNQWTTYSYSYQYHDLVHILAGKTGVNFTMDNYDAPIYIDDILVTEDITDINVAKCELVLHPADYSVLTADSIYYVESGDNAGNSYPADTVTFVGGEELGFLPDSNKVYVNLDASQFDGSKATFRFTTNATASGSLSVYGLANAEDADWTKDTINFANAPANDRSSGGVNLNKVYNGKSIYTVESAAANTTYEVDISGYVAEMKLQGATKITLIITGTNPGYQVAGGVDFDGLTSVAVNKTKDDTHTIENGKYYVSSNVALSVLNPEVKSDIEKGSVLQFSPTNKYAYVNLYNTFDHVLTQEDVGKTYTIQFDMKCDSVGYIYYGLSSKAKRAADAADYSNPYNFSRNQIDIAEEDVGKWITYTYTVTITEQMLPALVNGSTTQYAGVSLLGLYFRGFDGNIESGSDRNYNPAPVIQVAGFVTKELGATIVTPGAETVSYETVGGVDFEAVTSVAVNKTKDDAHTIENGKYYVSSNVALSVLNPAVVSDSARGTILQFSPTNKYAYVNLYNTFDHVLTSNDVGKTYTIQFDMKVDSVGYIYYGLSSKAKRAADSADLSNPYNFSRNQIDITQADVGKWITYTYTVTITQDMLPTLVNGSTTQYAGVSLLGLYFRGFDSNIESGSDRNYNPVPVIQIDNFKTYDTSVSITKNVSISDSVSVSGVSVADDDLIVKAPETTAVLNGIRKSYVMFAPQTPPTDLQKATLQFKVDTSAGQILKIYALNVDALPDNMSWNTAPANRNDVSMDAALLHGGEAVATLETVADTAYSVDVTDYVYGKTNGKYIFVMVSEEPSACQYMNLTFDVKNADLTGEVTVADGVATVSGTEGIRVEDAFGSGAVVTAGETYTVSALIKNTTDSAVTYSLAPAYADGTKAAAVSQSIAAGESKTLTLTFTATAQDVEKKLNAIAVSGGDCQIDDVIISGETPVVLTTADMKMCLETAQKQTVSGFVGDNEIKFSSAAPTLYDNIAMNYKANKTRFDELGITNPYVVVSFNGKETTITDYTVSEDGTQYIFSFYNIAPNQMDDTLIATLYGTYEGDIYEGATLEYSVAMYCYRMLNNSTVVDNADYAELRTLLVDLLHYGAAAQTFTGYEGELVNSRLTETQLAWGTATDPTLENKTVTNYATVENPSAAWASVGLVLEDAVTMRFKFTTTRIDGLTVKITSDTNPEGWVIDASNFRYEEATGRYYVDFGGLHAGQMRECVYVTVYDGDTAISNTLRYAVESYAYRYAESTAYPTLAELVKAMMRYGDAAYAFAN